MNAFLTVPLLLLLATAPAHAQMLSDKTGLLYRLDIEAGGHSYEVETVSTFDVRDYSFDGDQGRLTLHVFSGVEDNLGELLIPQALMGGDLAVYLDGAELPARIGSNERISFVTISFTGSGDSRIDVVGDSRLGATGAPQAGAEPAPAGGGCLVATAAYGSELAPQVQMLREVRDGKVAGTPLGAAFMGGFNQLYYSFSPHVADYQRENAAFNGAVRMAITPMVASLGLMSLAESEQEILAYGTAVMLLNVGLYLAAPAAALALLGRASTGRRAS